MEPFITKALQLLLSLSIIVLVHELGHFFFARLFKVRVDKFYLFFNPWFSLIKFKSKRSHTEYGLGWLPLGGYCKIAGMIDESLDTKQLAKPVESYEFRSKPVLPRLLIMTGGVLFNFLLAFFIYAMTLFYWGDTYIPLKNIAQGMEYSETFLNVGFRNGDILLRADGTELERFNIDALRAVADADTVTVLRDGQETAIPIPDDMMVRVLRDKKGFANIRIPMVVDRLADSLCPAALAGLQKGDAIASIDGIATPTVYDVFRQLEGKRSQPVEIGLVRWGQPLSTTLTTDTSGKMGIYPIANPRNIYPTLTLSYNFVASFPAGLRLGVNTLKGYIGDFRYVFTKEGASGLGGFGAIGSLFPATWNWQSFWLTTALLSIIIAFMNILPIPALDGGHTLFILYEIVTRRKPSDKFLQYAQVMGMSLLIALLIFANGNDLLRFLGH